MKENDFRFSQISVGQTRALDISLPVIEIGDGEPKMLILVGLHGDETTGYFVVHRLVNQ